MMKISTLVFRIFIFLILFTNIENDNLKAMVDKKATINIVKKSIIYPNKLNVDGSELKIMQNPNGDGVFVYHPNTRFQGIKRYLIWLVLDKKAYPLNGPSNMLTPSLVWPRDDCLKVPPAYEVIDFIFNNQSIKTKIVGNKIDASKKVFSLHEYRIYRELMSTYLDLSEDEAIVEIAAKHNLSVSKTKQIMKKVQNNLINNNLLGSPKCEIKAAYDWNGEIR